MPDTAPATDVSTLDAVKLRILSHYAAGTEVKNICAIVGMDREDVLDVIGQVAKFDRKRAGELIRQRGWRPTPPLAVIDREPSPPAATSEPEPVNGAAPALPADPPPPAADADYTGPLDAILIRAVQRGGQLGHRAGRIRADLVALQAALDDERKIFDAEAKVNRLRKQLDAANTALRDLKAAMKPTGRDGPE